MNTALVAGQYHGIDSTGKALQVVFEPDGKVKGLKDIQKYTVNIGFGGGPETGEDMFFFNIYKQQQDIAYRIKQDTLKLYTLRSDSSGQPYLHRPFYTLVRQR